MLTFLLSKGLETHQFESLMASLTCISVVYECSYLSQDLSKVPFIKYLPFLENFLLFFLLIKYSQNFFQNASQKETKTFWIKQILGVAGVVLLQYYTQFLFNPKCFRLQIQLWLTKIYQSTLEGRWYMNHTLGIFPTYVLTTTRFFLSHK